MKKQIHKVVGPEAREEYDFVRGARGKYARRYAQGANMVVLAPEVAKVFANSK